jgi:hypothetical protein
MLEVPIFVGENSQSNDVMIIKNSQQFLIETSRLTAGIERKHRVEIRKIWEKLCRAETMLINGLDFRVNEGVYHLLQKCGLITTR